MEDENNPVKPVIRIIYPVNIRPNLFPIHIEVYTKDDTASGKLLHTNLSYHIAVFTMVLLSTSLPMY